jgi:oligoendopeptidase F
MLRSDMSTAVSHEEVHWNLADLLDGEGEERVGTLLDEALERAEAFAERYRGALDDRRRRSARGDGGARGDLRPVGRAGSYAGLRFSTDTADPARGALLQSVQERGRSSRRCCCSSSWSGRRSTTSAPSSCWRPTASTSAATTCATSRRYRPHLLSEPEELILAEKALTARARGRGCSRSRPRDRGGARGAGDARRRAEPPAFALARHPARRREAVTAALEPGLRTRAFDLQHAARRQGDRRPPALVTNWLAARNLANEASDESVAALVAAVRAGATSCRAAGTG